MKAIILAAGMGRRLGNITKNKPKALVRLKKRELISYIIDMANFINISEVIVVGGSGFKQIKDYLDTHYPNIKLIENPSYQIANLYSLKGALPFVNDDFLLFNVDHIFSKKLLLLIKDICDDAKEFTVFCDNKKTILKDQMKVKLEKNYLKRISKSLINYDTGYIGIAFFPKMILRIVNSEVDKQIEIKGSHAVVEDIFNSISINDNKLVFAKNVSNHYWFEVDTVKDIESANLLLGKYSYNWV